MGRVPPALSGRDDILDRYHRWFSTKNSHGEVALIEGHRGVGKTSLLKVIGAQASSANWLHMHLEVTADSTVESLLAEVDHERLLVELQRLPHIGRRLRELSAELTLWGIGASVSASVSDPHRPRPRVALARFATRCEASGMGLLLTVDEIQRASSHLAQELGALANTSVPIVHVWAGLPGTRRKLQQRGVTASERARAFHLDTLDEAAANEALAKPFRDHGISLAPSVVSLVFEQSTGYPYFIQIYGDELWEAHQRAGAPGLIGDTIAVEALAAARAGVERFFGDRLEAMTPRARQALAALGGAPGRLNTGELAELVGLTTASFSERRAELLASGLATSPAHGQIALTFPALRNFLTSS